MLLTNSDQGGPLMAPFERRLIEIVYDARPQAAATVAASVERQRGMLARELAGLKVPPSPSAANKLSAHYTSPDLGKINVRRVGQEVYFDFGPYESRVAERDAPDGSVIFETIDPAVSGMLLIARDQGGKHTLTIRDGQHEYVYVGQ